MMGVSKWVAIYIACPKTRLHATPPYAGWELRTQCHRDEAVLTVANMAAISLECPNGSICQATRGLASAPKLSSTNFNPNNSTGHVIK